MRLQVTLALLCVLFPEALTLKCYQCIPDPSGTCTATQVDCPDQCASMTILTSTGGQKQQPLSRKVCATAAECISGSINLGTDKLVLQSQCCGTDLCNNQTVSALTFLPPNGKTCFTCSGNDCTDGVSCEGDADQCIGFTDTAAGAQATLNGCMSNSLRSAAAMILQALKVSGSVSYCNGDLCTSPASVSNAAPVKHKRAKRDTNVPSTVGVTQSTQTVSNSTTVGGNNAQSVNSSTTVGGNNAQSVNSSTTVGGNNIQSVNSSTTVGGNNIQSVNSSTTAGGNKTQSVNSSTTVGGNNNTQSVNSSTTVGGNNTQSVNSSSTVGGNNNTQSVSNSTTVGGNNTQSVNSSSTVGGNNTQSVSNSTTVGGNNAAGVKPTQVPIHVNNRTGGVSLSLLIMLVPLLSSMLFL